MRTPAPTQEVPTMPVASACRGRLAVGIAFVAIVLGVILSTAATTYATDGGTGGSVTINVNVPKQSSTTGPGGTGGPLPRTGADVFGLVVAAGALIGGGVMLTAFGRRRRYA